MRFVKDFLDLESPTHPTFNAAYDRSSASRLGFMSRTTARNFYFFNFTDQISVADDPFLVVFYDFKNDIQRFVLSSYNQNLDRYVNVYNSGNLAASPLCVSDPILNIRHFVTPEITVSPGEVLNRIFFYLSGGSLLLEVGIMAIWRKSDYISLPEGVEAVLPASMSLPLNPHVETRFAGGRVERTRTSRAKPLRFSLGFQATSEGGFYGDAVEKLIRIFDTDEVFFIDFGADSCQRYFVRRVGDLRFRISSPLVRIVDFGQITLEVAA